MVWRPLIEIAGMACATLLHNSPSLELCNQKGKTMSRARLYTCIEYVTATEDRYVMLDATEGATKSMGHLQRDSPEWFAWLETLVSFHFTGKCGGFTARKDQKKLFISYLGTTEKLTLAHLEEVAAVLEQKALHNS